MTCWWLAFLLLVGCGGATNRPERASGGAPSAGGVAGSGVAGEGCDDAPLLCATCGAVTDSQWEEVGLEPDPCEWTTRGVGEKEAAASGYAVEDFLEAFREPIAVNVAFVHAGSTVPLVLAITAEDGYQIVEAAAGSPQECKSSLRVGLSVRISSADCTLVGELRALASLPSGAPPGYWRVRLLDGEHALKGKLPLSFGELPEPQGLVTSFDLVKFSGAGPHPRLMLELLGFYAADADQTHLELLERAFPPDSCTATALPLDGKCVELKRHPDYSDG